MRPHHILAFLPLLFLTACAGKQLLPRLERESGNGTQARIEDPRGPIPAPSLPADLLAAGSGSCSPAVSGDSQGVRYTVVTTVSHEDNAPGPDREKESAELIETFQRVSNLYLLMDRPPQQGALLEQRLAAALNEAREVMHSLGWYAGRARGKIEAPQSGERDGTAVVSITFFPGARYRVGRTVVTASVPPDAPENPGLPVSLADVGLARGAPAVAADILASVDRARDSFRNNGYPFAAVSATRYIVDHGQQILEAETRITAGAFMRMGEMERHGAPTVNEGYLKNFRRWKTGEPWNQARVDAFAEALRQTGLFRNVQAAPAEQPDADGNHAVVAILDSAPERSVGGSVRFHSDFGPGVQAFWEHRNLTGNGDRLRINLPLWPDMQELTATYRRPFTLRRDQDFIANAALVNQDTDAYSLTSAAAAAGFERRLSRNWSGSLRGSAEGGRVKEPDKPRREYTMLGLPLGLTFDNTGSLLNATRGGRFIASLTPLAGEYDGYFTVLSSRAEGQRFIPLTDGDKLLLALRGVAGVLWGEDSSQAPPSARFYSGGGGSVRGYEFQSIGPRNADKDPLGGGSLVEVSAEARWNLTPEWGLVAFVDGGMVYEDIFEKADENLLWGAGLGVRYHTVIGPVRLDLATPLNPRGDDDPLQFYISIGQSF